MDKEKWSPAHNVSQDHNKSHFDSADFGFGDEPDAADARQWMRVFRRPRGERQEVLPPGFHVDVLPNFKAYQAIADAQNRHGKDVNAETHPRDVGFGAPRLHEVPPAVIHAVPHFPKREDVDLRGAEDQAEDPRRDHAKPVFPLVDWAQRLADRQAPVNWHQDQHVGGREHPHDLEVLDQPAEEVGSVEAERDVPDQLRQDLKDRDHQVRDAQVLHEVVHAGLAVLGGVDGPQDAQVARQSEQEHQDQHGHLHFGHFLVPLQGVHRGVPRLAFIHATRVAPRSVLGAAVLRA